MTPDDIERVLDHWLIEGPTQMPARFFNETFERIDRAPKRRVWLGLPRVPLASWKLRLAAVAAVAVALAGFGGAFLARNQGVGITPTPSPSPTAPAATPSAQPAELLGQWVPSGPRPANADFPSSITFRPTDFEFHKSIYGRYLSFWSVTPPDGLALVLQSTQVPNLQCPAGDQASYTFSLSPDGVLTFVQQGDSCLMRTANLGGDWIRFAPPLLPSTLQSSWTSDVPRPVPGGCCPARYDIVIGPSAITIPGFKADLASAASYLDPDAINLQVTMTPDAALGPNQVIAPQAWSCAVGDAGTYTFALAPDGQSLTLTPQADVCAARKAVLTGGWRRTDIGALVAGQHVSSLFTPFVGAGGHFSFTAPAGWSELTECATCLRLATPDDAIDIAVHANIVPSSPAHGSDCARAAAVERTPAAIAAWLASDLGLTVTAPRPVSIGGLDGVMVDAGIGPDWETAPCPFFRDGSGNVSLSNDQAPDPDVSIPTNGRARFILLDRGDGGTLLISLIGQDKMAWPATVAEAMPVVESFAFGR